MCCFIDVVDKIQMISQQNPIFQRCIKFQLISNGVYGFQRVGLQTAQVDGML